MIKQILQILVSEQIAVKSEIAARMGIQEETLDDIIDLLLKKGLLRYGECEEPDDTKCSGCSLAGSCHAQDEEPPVLYVTEKGMKYISKEGKRDD